MVISPPHAWQVRINASDIPVEPVLTGRSTRASFPTWCAFSRFRRAYEEDGLSVEELDSYRPTRRTFRQFMQRLARIWPAS